MDETTGRVQLPIAGEKLIPHRPPMLFVEYLTEREGDRAVGSVRVPVSGLCLDEARVFPEFFVEVIAQTVAMANGYDALCCGQRMNDGMLVGVDSFEMEEVPDPGAELRVVIEKTFEFGAVTLIHGELFSEGRAVARGDIKVWEKPGE